MPLAENNNLKQNIEIKINELGTQAIQNKALILTETDLQCALYQKLYEIPLLRELEPTADVPSFLTHKIHTEISWYDNDLLRIRPDITLLKPQNLKITEGFGVPLPTKGLHSVDGGIIFELKYDRELRTISEKKTIDGIFKDIRNFDTILTRFTNEGNGNLIYGFFVLFIKSSPNNPRNIQKINAIQNELNSHNLDDTKCKFIFVYIDTVAF